MDSNSIAQLVAAISENQKVSAPVVTQNSILIITMIIAAFGPIISGMAAWLASKAAQNTEKSKEEIVKVHNLVNSASELSKVKIESLEKTVKDMTIERATSHEKEPNQAIKDASGIALAPPAPPAPPAPLVMSEVQIQQLINALASRRSEPEITKEQPKP